MNEGVKGLAESKRARFSIVEDGERMSKCGVQKMISILRHEVAGRCSF